MPNMRPQINSINSSYMPNQDMNKSSWSASGGRVSNGYSNSSGAPRGGMRQGPHGQGSQQQFSNSGGRGRGRRNIVLNTKPGE
jgi:hypothetical protein